MTKFARCEVCGRLYDGDDRSCFCGVPYTTDSSHVPPAESRSLTMLNGILPSDSAKRKERPLARGVLDYFPLALAEVALVSKKGNDKHNPGEPLHWSKEKSNDHADCIVRHLIDRGGVDPEDGMRHSAKAAWRALALLEIELEGARDA